MSNSNITNGIALDCAVFNESIGVEKDLILINYSDFDFESTSSIYNRQTDDVLNNLRGLTNIFLKPGATQHLFEGTDYSVVPTVSPEVREDGNLWYTHSIAFTVYSKKSEDRETLITLGKSTVIAVTRDRSTGLYELFGMSQGLKVTGIDRAYTGSQNSNFYQVTIATPEINVIKEPSLSELSIYLDNGSVIPEPLPPGIYGDATPTVQGLVRVDSLEANPIVYLKATVDSLFARKDNILTTEALLESNKTSTVKWPAAKAVVDWIVARFEPVITASDTTKYWRGDKTWQVLDKNAVGLGNVDNTADADKPLTDEMITALENKADLVDGKVPASQLPSYISDVLEFPDLASFPVTGLANTLYVAISPSNFQYRWSGSTYIQITNGSIASTDDVPEGLTNLYFTVTRFLANLTFARIVTALGFTPEDVSNKQDSLAYDGTGTKYPTVDAINALTLSLSSDLYVEKKESETVIIDYGIITTIEQIDLVDAKFSVLLQGDATTVKSVQLSGLFIRMGKPHFFKNDTGHDVTIMHLEGTGNIKYFFSDGLDLVVKDQELVQFITNANDSSNVLLEHVGTSVNLDDYYTKTEVDALDALVLATANSYTDTELLDKADLVGGKVLASQLPSYVDDVIEGYLLSNVFYEESSHTTVILAEVGKIYIDLTAGQNNKGYRYSGSTYIQITNGLIASTDDVPEGSSNLYFQTARVLATLLTGISFATGGAIVSTDSVLVAFGKLQKQINDALTSIGLKQDTLVSGTNIKTVNGSTLLGSGNLVTPDMDTTTAQNVSGVKTFLAGKFGLRNTANTFTSFFASAVTASRTWTWPDKNGTVAMTSDIIAQLNGTVNRLVKFGTSTTGTSSRVIDDGNFLGVGSVSPLALSKDIQLGRQGNKTIGIEQSDSVSTGKDLTIEAGRTINFQETSSFLDLSQTPRNWRNIAVAPNGNVYTAVTAGDIYMQTAGNGNFIGQGAGNMVWTGICVDSLNNVYASVGGAGGTGNIYKQTGGVGAFVSMAQTVRAWNGMCVSASGDVYASVYNGDIYKLVAGTFVAQGQATRSWWNMAAAPNGDIYATVYNGDVYKQVGGIGAFTSLGLGNVTWRGITVTPNGNVYTCNYQGDIYMQTTGSGPFNALGQGSRVWYGLGSTSTGDVYATVEGGSIYKQNNQSLGTANLDGGALILKAGTGKGTGKSRVQIITGTKTASGTDMQVEVIRAEYFEDGNYKRIGTPVYADNTAALAGGLTAGMEYRTATGIKMEVY